MSGKNLSYERIPDIESEISEESFDKRGSFLSSTCRKAILVFILIFVGTGIVFSYFMSRHPQMVDGLGDVQVYLTSDSYNDRLRPMTTSEFRERGIIIDSLSFESGDLSSTGVLARATARVDSSTQFQTIIGFGGAFTEASAYNYYKLNPETRKKFMNLYFGERGIRYSVGRIHINSCDFSLKPYSFDEVEDDFKLKHFDHEVKHDQKEIIPFILEAFKAAATTSTQGIKLLASPWSPPAWMKEPFIEVNTSHHKKKIQATMTGSHAPNGLRNEPEVKMAWAQYISYFISAYKALGVDIWAVTPQNEPEFAAPWEACAYEPSFESSFVEGYLGPIIRRDHPQIKILAFDHNKDHLLHWAKTMLFPTSLALSQYVDGMAFHWYGGTGDRLLDGTYGYDAVNATYHLAPDKILMATEGCSCPGIEVDGWLRAERLGHDLLYDLANFAQGWIDWNLLVDHKGGPNHLGNVCDAPIFATKNFTDIHLQPKYYYMGHFSKFVPPGSVRISSSVVGNFKHQKIATDVHSGVELGMFPCEKSARQMWKWNPQQTNHSQGSLKLMTGTYSGDDNKPNYEMCVSRGDDNRRFLRVWECPPTGDAASTKSTQSDERIVRSMFFKMTKGSPANTVKLVDVSKSDPLVNQCVTVAEGSLASGGLLDLAPCKDHDILQQWIFDSESGELTSAATTLCMTAGWPYLSSVAFLTPESKKTVLILMNEAPADTYVDIYDPARGELRTAITAHSIETIIY